MLCDIKSIHSFVDVDLYEALANVLGKEHMRQTHELDLEAISHGDFGDVSQGLFSYKMPTCLMVAQVIPSSQI